MSPHVRPAPAVPGTAPVWGQHGAQGRRAAREATQVGTAGTLWGDRTPRSFLAWGQDLVSVRCFSSLVCWGQGHRTGCCPLNPGVRRGPCPLTPKHVLCSWGHGAGVTPSHPPLGSPVGDTKGPHMAGSPCWGGHKTGGQCRAWMTKRREPWGWGHGRSHGRGLGGTREPWGWGQGGSRGAGGTRREPWGGPEGTQRGRRCRGPQGRRPEGRGSGYQGNTPGRSRPRGARTPPNRAHLGEAALALVRIRREPGRVIHRHVPSRPPERALLPALRPGGSAQGRRGEQCACAGTAQGTAPPPPSLCRAGRGSGAVAVLTCQGCDKGGGGCQGSAGGATPREGVPTRAGGPRNGYGCRQGQGVPGKGRGCQQVGAQPLSLPLKRVTPVRNL